MKITPTSKFKRSLLLLSAGLVLLALFFYPAVSAAGNVEKEDLKFGFIKLTDMAPLAVAYEKGFFEDEGLYVQLEAQTNWKVLLDRVINGELDGAHMLAGQPLGTANPDILLLDEPLSALDALTRGNLQDEILQIWEQKKKTVILITNDVDEASLLADRVVMMTNGPHAKIGKIQQIDLPRPRSRKVLLEHRDYYRYRESLLTFLSECAHTH